MAGATSTTARAADGSMLDPLLATKLHLPRVRRYLIARPRLLARLDEAREARLLLVSAPAGFGKTTLLADWIHRRDLRVAWFSLDAQDNDPALFWRYLLAALRKLQPEAGADALAMLRSPQPYALDSVLTVLINELAALPDEFALVLDDYHVIESQPIHRGLAFLLEHLPEQLRLVIAGRADPPLPLARLRARHQVAELRAADLRCTAAEAAAFLHEVMGLHVSEEDVAALEARTEGWIAGLQLAALAMRDQADISGFVAAFTGSHRHILDYLTEEVLARQPHALQRFLLDTSILDRLTSSLCDAVT